MVDVFAREETGSLFELVEAEANRPWAVRRASRGGCDHATPGGRLESHREEISAGS